MKRILNLFTLFVLALASYAYDVRVDGICYNLNTETKEAEVTNGKSYTGAISIPESIFAVGQNYKVTRIGSSAFSGCSELTSVTIPNTVMSIGPHAFDECTKLPVIDNIRYADTYLIEAVDKTRATYKIKEDTRFIGRMAFKDCDNLTSVSIPNSVISIGNQAFYQCRSLKSIDIPNSVTSIGELAFCNCSSLVSVTIPNSVTSLGDCVFYKCWRLTSVTIPDLVTSIGESAFEGCSGLTSVTIGNSVTSIGEEAFYDCSGLTSVTIGNSVTHIGKTAFGGCRSLTSVVLPNSVTAIGMSAFSGCRSLTSINIPNSVNSIEDGTFYDCCSLTSITIPNSITSIGNYAFGDCQNLTSVNITDFEAWCKIRFGDKASQPLRFAHHLYLNGELITNIVIPTSITSIGDYAFEGCEDLSSVIIPNSITSIGKESFKLCQGLTSVIIPNSVTSIDDFAFEGCQNLTSVTFPNSVTRMGYFPFQSCPIKHLTIDSEKYCNDDYFGAQIETLIIGNSVTSIGSFSRLSSLASVTIGTSVTSIGKEAFHWCSNLSSIIIPNSVTSIGNYAFTGCSSLTSIIIPNSVTSIGTEAFSECTGLTSVTIGNSITSIDEQVFYKCSNVKELIYADGCTEAFRTYLKSIEKVTIPNSVTSIGISAFEGCNKLISVTIPNSLTSIGKYAFSGCYNVEELIYAEGCTTALCTGLTTMDRIVIPSSVTIIEDKAFAKCTHLGFFYCYAKQMPQIKENVLEGTDLKYTTLYVPNKSINDYSKAIPWRNFGAILPLPLSADAKAAVDKINAIGTVEYTDACKTLIEEARTAYDELSENDKSLITAEQLKVLTDAEAAYAELKAAAEKAAADQAAANAVVDLINAIGTVEYSDASKTLIDDARKAYDELTDDQKALVTAEQYEVLAEAENEYERLTENITGVEGADAISSQQDGKYIHNAKVVIVKKNKQYNIEGNRIR